MSVEKNMNLTHSNSSLFYNITTENVTVFGAETNSQKTDTIMIISYVIACVGITSNLTVVIAFMNHKQLRHKIPNMYIINQVSKSNFVETSFWWNFTSYNKNFKILNLPFQYEVNT